MNATDLLRHYARISEAPDAIPKLRRLVLDLAVRGKLVEQDATDEPAAELLTRIVAKGAVVDTKRRKSRDTSASNKLEEEPFSLPASWEFVPLAKLIRVLNGRAYKKQELLDAGTPVLRVGNLFTSNHWYYSDLELDEDKYCDAGDLIFAWSASFGPFIWNGPKVIFHYHIWKLPLISEEDLSKQYLYTFLLQKTREIKEAGHGMSMVHMTKEKMEKLLVPLPPLAEQHRIVAKVEELMALCDRLEDARTAREAVRDRLTAASLARLTAPEAADFQSHARFALQSLPTLTTRPDQIKPLRQTILNLAVRGKLVEQDAADEPAAELLRRILIERKDLAENEGIKVPRKTRLLDDGEIPFEIPENWIWRRLGDLVLHSDAGWSPQTLSHTRVGTEWGVLKVSAVSWGKFDPEANKQVLPGTKPRLQAKVREGDFLISRANTSELVARAVLVEAEPENLMMSDKIVRLRMSKASNKRFVWMVNNRPDYARAHYAANATGVSPSMKNVSRQTILDLPIPFPPIAEQHRIVAKVDALMALCDRLEASLTQADTTRQRLLAALLHEALEPAAKLETA